jgi:alpha-glucosidase
LSLHRAALRLRHEMPGLLSDDFRWRKSADGVLDFERGPDFRCVVNISGKLLPLIPGWVPLLSSAPLSNGSLPHDTAVWLQARQG